MDRKKGLIILLFVLLIISPLLFSQDNNWKDIMDFSTFSQRWDQATLSPNYNSVALTDNYIYIADSYRNRIFGFSYDSKYVKEIKGITTKDHTTFTPYLIFYDNNKLYIVNEDYKYIDIIDMTGVLLKEFKIKDSEEISGIYAKNNNIFLNVKYTKKERKRKIVTIFSEKGKKADEIGALLDTGSHLGYVKFNSVKISIKNNILYGAFDYYPLIFGYNIKTKKEMFWKDLRNRGLKEIDILIKKRKEYGKDWLDSVANKSIINLLRFCSGFDVDNNGNIYYLITGDFKKAFPTTILKFDKEGKLLEKMEPKYNNQSIGYSIFLKIFNNSLYIIGSFEDNFHLFSSPLSK